MNDLVRQRPQLPERWATRDLEYAFTRMQREVLVSRIGIVEIDRICGYAMTVTNDTLARAASRRRAAGTISAAQAAELARLRTQYLAAIARLAESGSAAVEQQVGSRSTRALSSF